MNTFTPKPTILLTLLSLHLLSLTTEAKNLVRTLSLQEQNPISTNHSITLSNNSYSPWLTRFRNPRFIGCRRMPWICDQTGDFPRIRRKCCRNRCTDVASDPNNCGLCGIRCPFTWQCCRGICINTNINPFHCGRCFHRCRFPSFCFYGMCNYAQPLPPFPWPFPPRPWPPKPPRPFPPRPWPRPWPPKPPRGGGRWGPPPVGGEEV